MYDNLTSLFPENKDYWRFGVLVYVYGCTLTAYIFVFVYIDLCILAFTCLCIHVNLYVYVNYIYSHAFTHTHPEVNKVVSWPRQTSFLPILAASHARTHARSQTLKKEGEP